MNWKTSETHPLRIAEITLTESQKLGLSFCPGKTQPNAMSGPWKRDLGIDLARIQSEGYDVVVTLIEEHEFRELQVEGMRNNAVKDAEMRWIWTPVRDGGVPTDTNNDGLNSALEAIFAGDSVFVHCKGGLGRAGTVTAWLLTHLGRSGHDAIMEVRSVRDKAVENPHQERWVQKNSNRSLGQ